MALSLAIWRIPANPSRNASVIDLVHNLVHFSRMTQIINVHDAKTHFSKLLNRAHAGEEIILAKAGKPYAKLVPIVEERPQRRPGRFEGQFVVDDSAFFDPLPEEELRLWEGRDD
ncbi:type II toxin-antitoxin system Phd/YefM family antitoxin [Sphingobium sp. YR768]|jgi:prevent-host-death family protein|nr:type II toxin-antitoxin system Phd/YefM family antitoxin [Sphingobium sp. YR768]